MTIASIILSIIYWLLAIAGVLGIVGIFIFIPLGIIFLVKSASVNDQEAEKKGSLKRKGVWLLALPFILIIGSLIFQVVLSAFKTAMGMK